jgi:hypothetical protein
MMPYASGLFFLCIQAIKLKRITQIPFLQPGLILPGHNTQSDVNKY